MKIFNTLIGDKQTFKPIEPGKIGIYVCGITAYDFCHLGHARVMIVFDMVVCYLRSQGWHVNYVRNITDVDDKIIDRAHKNGEDIDKLTARFIDAMHQDAALLGITPPDAEPRVTQHMELIIDMIQRLLDKDHAYRATNGDIYYAVNSFPDYGKLSGRKLDQLIAGKRVEIQQEKRDPLDFVLWKMAKAHEPAWDSPWGSGRPGWHIECSAMSTHCLGDHFDIHGGGHDLQFPHHENEIAQSQGATGKPFVNIWMHNGFVRSGEEKMSKSLNNFFTVREILEEFRAEEIRFFILASHYRSPLQYTAENLQEAATALRGLYKALHNTAIDQPIDQTYLSRFRESMDDDFNTPQAIALLHELAHHINIARDSDPARAQALAATLKELAGILGLLQQPAEQFLQSSLSRHAGSMTEEEIQALVAQREQARRDKDFNESDRIRDRLAEIGIILEDTSEGTFWQRS